MSTYKLGVEVVSATNLMPKDGQGSSSPFVELHFDHQVFRTTVKEKDLQPVWNESFYFNISDTSLLPELSLEAYVYNNIKESHSKSFLGKVRIAGTAFVPYHETVVMYYPLEKRMIFSRVKGELGLRVFITNDPSIRSSNPLPIVDPPVNSLSTASQAEAQVLDPTVNPFVEKSQERHTFHHLPRKSQPPVSVIGGSEPMVKYSAGEMRPEPPPGIVRMLSSASQQPVDYSPRETSPFLGGGKIVGGRVIRSEKPSSTYDLVEQMHYLFVRIVKAKDLPTMDITGSLDPYVEVRLGNYKGKTKTVEKNQNPEWNEVFAFSKDRLQATYLDVVVKDKDLVKDDFVGLLRLDLNEVPMRVPPDSPLAPEWCKLETKKGGRAKGELMLAVWIGTQADECFPESWHSDEVAVADASIFGSMLRSKVYHSPRLWYVRVNVIEAQDIVVGDRNRLPDVHVKARIGVQMQRTKAIQARTLSPLWNEEFMFVAAEPFEDHLILSVEDHVASDKVEVIGMVAIPLSSLERRVDDRPINTRWYNLERDVTINVDQLKKDKFSSKIHLRVCLEGGYHVLDESTNYSSDLRPTARQMWKPAIGLLELGILSCEGLHPMKSRDGKGSTDAYCVAKYGHKWVRTRTIINSLCPKYNEQYTWQVFDPATVLTVGVFDNSHIEEGKDSNGHRDIRIGKVRIRLSTLQTGRVYTHSYPLLVLHPSGVKKMGEIHLAIRFSCTSLVNTMFIYSKPLLPKLHYIRPLSIMQQDYLRRQSVNIVAARLSRMEPPLRKEVIEYMSDVDSHLWSMRKSKANFFRLMSVFSSLFAVGKWFGEVCAWKNPITTVLVHILFVMLSCFPELILPTVFLYMFLIGVWNYRFRPRYPPHMNTSISKAEAVHPDELDEEFDTFPTPSSRNPELVRIRYDRLRGVAGKIQTTVGDIATQGERFQALLSWRDPRASALFILFCLIAALVLYVMPFQVLVVIAGLYQMRHPRFRHRLPSAPLNFFRRLPARNDSML